MIKKLLFKKEWEKIEKEKEQNKEFKDSLIEMKDMFERYKKEEKEKIRKEKDEMWDKYEKHLKEDAQEKLKKYQKKLKEIYDYKLFPGAKVWVFGGIQTFDNKPIEVEIERVIFEKDRIRVDDWTRFFFTEQEAIKAHNKEIKKLLLK